MPGLNGFQATRTLTRDPQTKSIPVVMITTKGQETDRIWGMRQGAVDYLVKPVGESDLIAKAQEVLEAARGYGNLSLEALVEQPFELLLELERRAKAAIAAREGADTAERRVGRHRVSARRGAIRGAASRRSRDPAAAGLGHARAGRQGVVARYRQYARPAHHGRRSALVPRRGPVAAGPARARAAGCEPRGSDGARRRRGARLSPLRRGRVSARIRRRP